MHKVTQVEQLNKILTQIDFLPLHPKYNVLLYSHHLVFRISWHFTLADFSKTWVSEDLDDILASCVRKWLEIPVRGALSNIFLIKTYFGLNIHPPSTIFFQCQTITLNVLKSSLSEDIQNLWKSTSTHTNLQYDNYKNTKQLLKVFHSNEEDRLKSHLVSWGSFFSAVISHSLLKLNSIWSSAQSNLQ